MPKTVLLPKTLQIVVVSSPRQQLTKLGVKIPHPSKLATIRGGSWLLSYTTIISVERRRAEPSPQRSLFW
jgi:hypothetical protein